VADVLAMDGYRKAKGRLYIQIQEKPSDVFFVLTAVLTIGKA
jgi:hypothetical protein